MIPKLDVFLDRLNNQLFNKSINYEGKLVVFSESKETTAYLSDKLKKQGYGKVLTIRSDNRTEKMPLLNAKFLMLTIKGHKKKRFIILC